MNNIEIGKFINIIKNFYIIPIIKTSDTLLSKLFLKSTSPDLKFYKNKKNILDLKFINIDIPKYFKDVGWIDIIKLTRTEYINNIDILIKIIFNNNINENGQ